MKKTWKPLAELAGAVVCFGLIVGAVFAQTSDQIWPQGKQTPSGANPGAWTRSTTSYQTVVDSVAGGPYVPLAGGTMTGPLRVHNETDDATSVFVMAHDADNTTPTVTLRVFTDQASTVKMIEVQDEDGVAVASISGAGLVVGTVGGFTSSVYTPSLISGLVNENMSINAVGTGKILLNAGVVLQNAGPLTITPGAATSVTNANKATVQIPVGVKTVLMESDGNYSMTMVPTIAAGTDPVGTIMDVMMAVGENNYLVLSDQALLADSNLLLGATTRTLRYPGHLRLRFDGTDWQEVGYVSGETRMSVTVTLDFGSTAAGTTTELTTTITGAADGDIVTLGVPAASVPASYGTFFGYVSASNTVTIRFANNALVAAADPASGSFRIGVDRLTP